ncbi:hypothetical protein LXL04_002412 [Taraxacum kok-saghyz]
MAAAVAAAGDTNSTHSEQNPGIRRQKIVLRNSHGEKLVGLLHETGSREIESNTMMNLASALEKEGITAFRFDFAGNGESEGTFQYGNYRREADDLHSVIQHFSASNRVTSAILGHSKGGNVVLLYASKYHDVHCVINVSGRYKTEGGVEERLGKGYLQKVKKYGFIDVKAKTGEVLYRVTEESLMDRLNTNMHEACLQINKDCRVLTVHGSDDSVVGVEEALEFDKIIPNHKLHIIKNANHGFSKHQDELISLDSIVPSFLQSTIFATVRIRITPTLMLQSQDSPFRQSVRINHNPHTLNSRRNRIRLKMAAGDSTTTSANLDQNPGTELQKIIIQNKHGEKLVGLLHETGSKEIVIVCHGFQCTKKLLYSSESEGSFEFGNYLKEADDLQSVIQHLTKANRVITAILGHSKGGDVVVLYASLHHDIKSVVNVSGRYKMDRGIEERLGKDYLERAKKDGFIDIKSKTGDVSFRVTEESLKERLNTNMHEAGLKIDKNCKVLTVHGSDDEVIPVEDAIEFAKIIPNHELKIIEGANHGYNKHRDELCSVVVAFFTYHVGYVQHVKPPNILPTNHSLVQPLPYIFKT